MTHLKKICSCLGLPVDKLERSILLLTAILVSIWLMRDTIALRNILLVTCSLLSIFYLYRNFKKLFIVRKIPIKNWMPIILLALLFIWVVTHLFFFARDPVLQFQELTSTWMRSLLSALVGFTVGLIISRNPIMFNWIIASLISGFVILFYQYIGLVLQSENLFQQMWWNSIYWGKVNEVLLGILYIGCCLGVMDSDNRVAISKSPISTGKSLSISRAIYLLGILLVLHCFVFEIDTRNGMGIAVILIIIFIAKYMWCAFSRKMHFKNKLPLILAVIGILFFTFLQVKNNSGWKTYLEDIKISVQVDRYDNWMTAPARQLIVNERKIPMNTYERTAWLVVALQTIPKYPLGYGLLHNSFGRVMKINLPSSTLTSSHNGWLDFGFSMGLPGLSLLLGALFATLLLSISSNTQLASVVFWMVIGLLLSYALAELMVNHGVEFLIFWVAFLPAILFPRSK